MDFLKSQFDRIQKQLVGLSASQKMLTVSLVAIMVMTLVWWARYAGDPEMVPVLDQSLAQDDVAQITAMLDGKQIAYKMVGDKIMIPTDRRFEVLADLSFAHMLPHDFATGFDEIGKQLSPWDSSQKMDAMYNHAKEMTLGQVLSRFPDVMSATVMIDNSSERSFTGNEIQPRASINIITRSKDHAHTKQIVGSAADLVSGYVAGLARSRVNVIVDGVANTVKEKDADDALDAGEDIALISNREDYYCKKIREDLQYINGLTVSVTVSLDTKKVDTKATIVDPKQAVHLELSSHERTEESTGASAPGGEPGAQANTGVSVNGAGGGGSISSITDTQTNYQNVVSSKEEVTHQGPGNTTVLTASVQVPRSYFQLAYKNKFGKDADESALTQMIDDEKKTIRQQVASMCGLISKEDAVVVGVYSDAMPVIAPVSPQLASAPVVSLVGMHGKEVGVGALAVVSLFMMMMMVRKGAPMPLPIPASVRAAAIEIDEDENEEELAGQARAGGTTLDAVELDDDTVKTQQMLDQVQQMVTENPDAAASLVKRWLNRA